MVRAARGVYILEEGEGGVVKVGIQILLGIRVAACQTKFNRAGSWLRVITNPKAHSWPDTCPFCLSQSTSHFGSRTSFPFSPAAHRSRPNSVHFCIQSRLCPQSAPVARMLFHARPPAIAVLTATQPPACNSKISLLAWPYLVPSQRSPTPTSSSFGTTANFPGARLPTGNRTPGLPPNLLHDLPRSSGPNLNIYTLQSYFINFCQSTTVVCISPPALSIRSIGRQAHGANLAEKDRLMDLMQPAFVPG